MIENKLIKIVKNTFSIDECIDLHTTKNDISSWDAIGHLNLILDMEEGVDISFSILKTELFFLILLYHIVVLPAQIPKHV